MHFRELPVDIVTLCRRGVATTKILQLTVFAGPNVLPVVNVSR